MEPIPVNMNNPALLALLKNARNVMKKVENNDFTTGHVDPRALTEDGIQELQREGVTRPISESRSQSQTVTDYTEEQVRNSKFPEAIKKAMLEKKIPRLSMTPASFSLDDVSEMIEKPMGLPRTPKTQPKQQIRREPVNESMLTNNSDMITVSKGVLKDMINESIIQVLTENYSKTLTEEAIKKTINMLIKEGKITIKKKQ